MSKKLVDKGWDEMNAILDREMPTANKKRRPVLIFWLLIGLLSSGLIYYFNNNEIHISKKKMTNDDQVTARIKEEISSTENIQPKSMDYIGKSNTAIKKTTISSTEVNKTTVNLKKKLVASTPKSKSTNAASSSQLDIAVQAEQPNLKSGQELAIQKDNLATEGNLTKQETIFENQNLDPNRGLFVAKPITGNPSMTLSEDFSVTNTADPLDLETKLLPMRTFMLVNRFSHDQITFPSLGFNNQRGKTNWGAYLGAANSFGGSDFQSVNLGLFVKHDYNSRIGVLMGAGVRYALTDFNERINASVIEDLEKNSISTSDLSPVEVGITRMHTIAVSTKLVYNLTKQWSFLGGLELNYLLDYTKSNNGGFPMLVNSSTSGTADTKLYAEVNKVVFNKWDLLPIIGIQYNLSRKIGLQLSYAHGLKPIFNQNTINSNAQKRRELRLTGNYYF